ncbi:MAG: energy transducer TonB, partial [Acidobacteriota bacterium]
KFVPPTRGKLPVATKARLPLEFASSYNLARELFETDVQPVPLKRVSPGYPAILRRRGQSGEVTLRFVVTAEGRVGYIRVVKSSHPGFDEEALKAVKQWTYKPGQLKGKPVATWLEQTVAFKLSEKRNRDANRKHKTHPQVKILHIFLP